MSTPGWYPDPQDADLLRYYDGQSWTEHRQPAAGSAPPPAQSEQTAAEPPADSPAEPQPQPQPVPPWQQSAQAPPPEPQVQSVPPWQQPARAAPSQPESQATAPWQQYGATPQPYSAAPSDQPYGTAPYQQSYGAPAGYGGAPAQPAPRRSRKLPLILAVVVVLVAGLLTGGYFLFFNNNEPTLTYAGKSIKDANGVLKTAESSVTALVSKRHGAKNDQTRCYFAVPKKPEPGKKKTDVDTTLRCGPVLFVDGDPSSAYLGFPMTAQASGSQAVLTVASAPSAPDPDAIPADVSLKRPDGKSAPNGSGGLKVPAPPAAQKNAVAVADINDVTVAAAQAGAVMGSLNGGIALVKLGKVQRYGHGDAARSAPAGEQLIAFQTAGVKGNNDQQNDLTSQAMISVDGGTGVPVPDAQAGQYIVAAVPTDAKSVDLVLDDEGLKQSLSLLDGKPGAQNVTVLARTNRDMTTPVATSGVFTFSPKVKFDDGTSGTSEAIKITMNVANLLYRTLPADGAATASSPAKAILHISVTYKGAHDIGEFGFPSALLTFTPTGGAAVKAVNRATVKDKLYNTFEVPGNMTGGVLTIAGKVKQPFSGGGGSYTVGLRSPVRVSISIPLK